MVTGTNGLINKISYFFEKGLEMLMHCYSYSTKMKMCGTSM